MSKSKVLVLIVGLVAVGAFVFVAAGRLHATSPAGEGTKASSCDTHAKTASAGGCAKATAASASCPVASCPVAAGGKGCPGSAAKSCGSKAAQQARMEAITDREGETMVLTGHYVCGRCDLGVSDACQPGFQTKDGKNYLLVKNNLSNRLHELHETAKDSDVEAVTRVKKLDGVKYLEVEAVRNPS